MRPCSLLLLSTFLALVCAGQSNRDLLFSETWHTAEGLVMTFDSSGVTWEGSRHKYMIDEHAIRHTKRTELVDGQSRNVVYANYQVHTDSLILEFVYDVALWMCPPVPRMLPDVENEKPKLVLYSTAHFDKKEPIDNFLSFSIHMDRYAMSIESNGAIAFKAWAQMEFADRVVYGVYRGWLDSSQLYALRTALRDSGFFQMEADECWRDCRRRYYACNTLNNGYGSWVRCWHSTQSWKIRAIINDILLSSSAWERNGMKYYGLKGELVEPVEQIFLDWKTGMPEKPRIAVAGSIRFVEKVSTIYESEYLYVINVDTVFGAPSYFKNAHQYFKRDLIVVSKDPINVDTDYYGLVLADKVVHTPTWQTDHTGHPYCETRYFDLIETFPVEGVSPVFLVSRWDRDYPRYYYVGGWNWDYRNGPSSHLEFKVAKAVRKAQGQDNYIRRDRNGSILPLVE